MSPFSAFIIAGIANGSDKITSLSVPGLSSVSKHDIITGIQKAGTIAGSLGLASSSAKVNPYIHDPLFPTIQHIARTAFVDGTIDILIIAGCILAVGAVLSIILIRDRDMFHFQRGE